MIKRLRFLLLGSPDRVITTISLLTGIVGLVLSLLAYVSPEPPPWYYIVRDDTVIITLVFMISTLSVKYLKKDKMAENFRGFFAEQGAAYHYLIHNFRDHFFWDMRKNLINTRSISLGQIDALKQAYFENVCRSVLADTREIFKKYYRTRGLDVDDDLTLSVDLIIPAEDAQRVLDKVMNGKAHALNTSMNYVLTTYLDPTTWGQRPERSDSLLFVYHINDENTMLDKIINKDERCFLSNDLHKEFENGQYKNQNPDWHKQLNSILAIPVRYKRQGDNRSMTTYGIISISSLNPRKYDLFDSKRTFNMLAASADILALMFGHFDLLQLAAHITLQKENEL